MTDFSWDYVTLTASEAMADLGRSVSATIAQAVEPGIYVVEPDAVYEVRATDAEASIVLRNGVAIVGPDAEPSDRTLALVAAEIAGVATTIDVRTSVEMVVAV